MTSSLLPILVSLCVAWWLTDRLRRPTSRLFILDHPNDRSLHDCPTPRSGGVAIVLAVVAGWLLMVLRSGEAAPLLVAGVPALAVAAISFADDRTSIRPSYRLAVHLLAALMLVSLGDRPQIGLWPGSGNEWSGLPVSVVALGYVVWMTNLYNFMDGMDGFAGGMAVVGFGGMAYLGWTVDQGAFALACAVVAAAAGGFLLLNFPPARIFMGDTGSSFLGFLAAALTLWGATERVFPLWVGILLFLPFIADATVTLVRRALRGERLWQAHRSHYYQRLVRLGWGHRRTVLVEYALMAVCAGAALVGVRAAPALQWALLVAVGLLFAAFFAWVEWLERRARRPAQGVAGGSQ